WTGSASFFDKTEAELRGRPIADVLGPEIGGVFLDNIRRVLASESSESFEYVLDHAGDRRHYAAHVAKMPRPPVGAAHSSAPPGTTASTTAATSAGAEPRRTVTVLVRDV